MKYNKLSVVTFIILLLVAMTAISVTASDNSLKEDFSAKSSYADIKICKGSSFSDKVSITKLRGDSITESSSIFSEEGKTGYSTSVIPIPTVYSVSYGGSAASFVTAVPDKVILTKGETEFYEVIINPPKKADGKYNLITYVESEGGIKKKFEQVLEVVPCQTIEIKPVVYTLKDCPCSSTKFEYDIKNIGSEPEIIDFSLNKFSENVVFSEQKMKLAPGEEKRLYLYFNPECSVFGKYDIKLKASARNSGLTYQTKVYFDILPCYDFSVAPGESYVYTEETEMNPPLFSELDLGEGYKVCDSEVLVVPVKVENNAEIENNYEIKIKGDVDWKGIDTEEMILGPESSDLFNVVFYPPKYTSGEFVFSLTVLSELGGGIVSDTKIPLLVENCYVPEISEDYKEIVVNYTKQDNEFIINNTGIKKVTYMLDLEGVDFAEFDKYVLSLNPGESKSVNIRTYPTEDVKQDKYPVVVKLTSKLNGVEYEENIVIRVKQLGFFGKVWEFIKEYKWYLLNAMILLIILLVLISYVNKHPIKEDKKVLEKEEKKKTVVKKVAKKEVVKSVPKKSASDIWAGRPKWLIPVIVGILILLLVGALGYFSYKKYSSAGSEDVTGDEGTVVVEGPEGVGGSEEVTEGELEEVPLEETTEDTPPDEVIPTEKNFFQKYWSYIIVAIILLAILLFIIYVYIKSGQPSSKKKIKKEKVKKEKIKVVNIKEEGHFIEVPSIKKREEKKKSKRWILFLILILLGLFAIGFIGYVSYNNIVNPPEEIPLDGDVLPEEEVIDDLSEVVPETPPLEDVTEEVIPEESDQTGEVETVLEDDVNEESEEVVTEETVEENIFQKFVSWISSFFGEDVSEEELFEEEIEDVSEEVPLEDVTEEIEVSEEEVEGEVISEDTDEITSEVEAEDDLEETSDELEDEYEEVGNTSLVDDIIEDIPEKELSVRNYWWVYVLFGSVLALLLLLVLYIIVRHPRKKKPVRLEERIQKRIKRKKKFEKFMSDFGVPILLIIILVLLGVGSYYIYSIMSEAKVTQELISDGDIVGEISEEVVSEETEAVEDIETEDMEIVEDEIPVIEEVESETDDGEYEEVGGTIPLEEGEEDVTDVEDIPVLDLPEVDEDSEDVEDNVEEVPVTEVTIKKDNFFVKIFKAIKNIFITSSPITEEVTSEEVEKVVDSEDKELIEIVEIDDETSEDVVIEEPVVEEDVMDEITSEEEIISDDLEEVAEVLEEEILEDSVDLLFDCAIIMEKNTVFQINLNDAFHDPDGDMLSYSSTVPDHVAVDINEEGIVTLVPEMEWVGSDYIIFSADDGREEGIVSSEVLKICVKEKEKVPMTKSIFAWVKGFFVGYSTYIITGIIILVIVILLMNLNETDDKEPQKPKKSSKKQTKK